MYIGTTNYIKNKIDFLFLNTDYSLCRLGTKNLSNSWNGQTS